MRDCLPLIMQCCVSSGGRQACYLVSRLGAPVQGRVCLDWAGFLACQLPFDAKLHSVRLKTVGERGFKEPGVTPACLACLSVVQRFGILPPAAQGMRSGQEPNSGRAPRVVVAAHQGLWGRWVSSLSPF